MSHKSSLSCEASLITVRRKKGAPDEVCHRYLNCNTVWKWKTRRFHLLEHRFHGFKFQYGGGDWWDFYFILWARDSMHACLIFVINTFLEGKRVANGHTNISKWKITCCAFIRKIRCMSEETDCSLPSSVPSRLVCCSFSPCFNLCWHSLWSKPHSSRQCRLLLDKAYPKEALKQENQVASQCHTVSVQN